MGEACCQQPSEKWQAYGKSLLKFFGQDIKRLPSKELLDQFMAIGKKPVKTKNIEADLSDSLKDLNAQFKKDFSSKKCDLNFWKEKEKTLNKMHEYFKQMFQHWSEYKKSHGFMDIQDLELITYKLLKSEPQIVNKVN